MAEETQDSSDRILLGGNIHLAGFRDLDSSSMVIIKKIVGNYARRFSEISNKFESLSITLKRVHEKEKSEKYELKAMLMDNGKNFNAETINRNLFFALDEVLKKIEKSKA